MTTYVALLRGIMPTNPNMKGEKLKGVFESLGFKDVSTVIASGNVVFKSPSTNIVELGKKVEKALPTILGFNSTTIIKSKAQLESLVASDPFKGVTDKRPNYLLVTFFKDARPEVCTVIDLSQGHNEATKSMTMIEKKYGKEITSRTWKTVHRILKKMK